ncbi:MAG: HAD family phosphatase [Bacteroidales bacterium]|jgi:putative hydrolase of the HAD superfamily|nr:HAD family phosphatase [Bacteroidales bacterium]
MNSKVTDNILSCKKAFLFDLGGVIYHINPLKTIEKFSEIFKDDILTKGDIIKKDPLFSNFECGRISEHDFISGIKQFCKPETTQETIISAWNAMLMNLPIRNLIAINRLRQTHKVFMLSNTNKIHIDYITRQLKNNGLWELYNRCFDKIYYSYEIGCAKPDKEPFNFVLSENNLKASDVIFIDDSAENIETTTEMGIYSVHLKTNSDLTALI